MIVNNIHFHGIFVWDDNYLSNPVTFEVGDHLIFEGSLYIANASTQLSPNDTTAWDHESASIATVTELLSGGAPGKFVDARVTRDALFGDNGIITFLKDNLDGTNDVKSWGRDLSDIKTTSSYVVTIGATNIHDWPSILVGYQTNIPGIVNTFKNGTVFTQELLSFSEVGKLYSYSIRVGNLVSGSIFYNSWNDISLNNPKSELFNKFEVTTEMFRTLLKYSEQTAIKHELLFDGSTTSFTVSASPTPENPMRNILVEVSYDKVNVLTGGTIQTGCKTWVSIFLQDIIDSNNIPIYFDAFPNSNCKLYISYRTITVENGTINKIVKFIGDGSESSDGSDYYQFGFSD